jgi:hypothetical protein
MPMMAPSVSRLGRAKCGNPGQDERTCRSQNKSCYFHDTTLLCWTTRVGGAVWSLPDNRELWNTFLNHQAGQRSGRKGDGSDGLALASDVDADRQPFGIFSAVSSLSWRGFDQRAL